MQLRRRVGILLLTALVAAGFSTAVVDVVAPAPASALATEAFHPITPTRALDTREAKVPLAPGASRPVAIAGVGGVPDGAVAVALNVTVVTPATAGFLTIYPTGTPRPVASNLNFVSGQIVANMVLTGLGSGSVDVFNGSGTATNIVVDVTGWYSAGFEPTAPTRVIDTRTTATPLTQGQTRRLKLSDVIEVPEGATAVAVNVTVTEPTAAGYLTVFPAGSARPTASNLNFVAGHTVPNMVISGITDDGIDLFNNSGNTHVIVDVMGWFTSGYTPLVPTRVMDTRIDQCLLRLGPGQTRLLKIAGVAGVPANAGAVALNVTAVHPTAATYLTIWPSGTERPIASNLNPITGVVPNMVTVGLGSDGRVAIYNLAGVTDVVVDVFGWYDGAGNVSTASQCETVGGQAPPPPTAADVAGPAPGPIKAASFGQAGPSIAAMQGRLLLLGYWVPDIDGNYGHATSQAVMAFQKANGRTATGNLSEYDAFLLSMMSYRSSGASTTGDRMEVDKGRQLLHVIRGGKVLWTVNTSTGSDVPYTETNQREGGSISGDAHTPIGRFRVGRVYSDGWESGQLGELYRPRYFNGGIAVHGSNYIPNFPASHGCVRTSIAFMDFVWDAALMPIGTEVWVHD